MNHLLTFIDWLTAKFPPKPRLAISSLVGHTKACESRGGSCTGVFQCARCRRLVGCCESMDDDLPDHCNECWWEAYREHEDAHRVAVSDDCPFCDGGEVVLW